MDRNELLNYKSKTEDKNIIPWVTTYDPRQPNIRNLLQDNKILDTSSRMKKINETKKVIIAERRNCTIGNLLKMNKLRQPVTREQHTWGCKPCDRRRPPCKACNTMETTNIVKNRDSKTFQIKDTVSCDSSFVVYCLTCACCGIQYVGQTITPFNIRLNKHRSNIKLNKAGKAPRVAPHFNIPGHSFKTTILQKIYNTDKRKLDLAESIWIHKLNTVWPSGLNEYNPDTMKNFSK